MIDWIKKILYGTVPHICLGMAYPQSPKLKYYKFFREHPYTHFPYDFAREYLELPVMICWDGQKNLPFVEHGGKKLYFPREFSEEKITKLYRALRLEQDCRYPHHYVDDPEEFRDRTLIDVGAAEGMISLDAVEKARFVYMFESDPRWIETLQATFAPWKNKVTIVEKYVSDICSDNTMTLDHFFEDKPKERLFLKMDIEGAECKALKGTQNLFRQASDLEFAICTYHRKNDLRDISAFLDRFSCSYAPREGYIYVNHRMRTGLVRGHKGNTVLRAKIH